VTPGWFGGPGSALRNFPKIAKKLMRLPPAKRRRANVSALRTDVMRAAALLAREEVVVARLRFAREASPREELAAELIAIRRELRLLGFKTL